MEKKNIVILLLSISMLTLISCNMEKMISESTSGTETPSISIKTNGRMLTLSEVSSEYLDLSRKVRIYLPASYYSSTNHYPVMILHDGQNVFAPGGPFGCWNAEQTYDALISQGRIKEVILVAVDNTSARMSEYTPDTDPSYGGGNGDQYLRFLAHELLPTITEQFRTLTGPENTAILGSSLGGLISIYAGIEYPEIFGMAACMSSSIWWNSRSILDHVDSHAHAQTPVKFWLDAGTAEGSDPDGNGLSSMSEDAYRLTEILHRKGWSYGDNLMLDIDWGAGHNEAAWDKRFYRPLLFFFGTSSSPEITNIITTPSSKEIDKSGVIPSIMLITRAYYDNGLESTLLSEDLGYYSEQSNLFDFVSSNHLTLNNSNINSDTNLIILTFLNNMTNQTTIDVFTNLSTDVAIFLHITTPTFSGSQIYMVGDHQLIGGWQPAQGYILYEASQSNNLKVFTNTLMVPRNTSLSFKFLSGTSWSYEELNGSGSPINNRVYTVNSSINDYHATVLQWRTTP